MKLSPDSHHRKKMLVPDKASSYAYYKDRSPAFCPHSSSSAARATTWVSHQNVL